MTTRGMLTSSGRFRRPHVQSRPGGCHQHQLLCRRADHSERSAQGAESRNRSSPSWGPLYRRPCDSSTPRALRSEWQPPL